MLHNYLIHTLIFSYIVLNWGFLLYCIYKKILDKLTNNDIKDILAIRQKNISVIIPVILFLGISAIVNVSLLLTVTTMLNRDTIFYITVSVMMFNTTYIIYILYKKHDVHLKKPKLKLKVKLNKVNLFDFLFILLGIFVIFFYMSPIHNIYVFPGGDDRGYALVTSIIIHNQGYPFNTRILPLYIKEDIYHMYMIGFPLVAAYVSVLLGIPIGETHLFLFSYFHALIYFSNYFFVFVTTKDKRLGIVTSLFLAVMFKLHAEYLYWGGSTEIPAYYLALMCMGIYFNYTILVPKLNSKNVSFIYGLFLVYMTFIVILFHILSGLFLILSNITITFVNYHYENENKKHIINFSFKYYFVPFFIVIMFLCILIFTYDLSSNFKILFLVRHINILDICYTTYLLIIHYMGYHTTKIFLVILTYMILEHVIELSLKQKKKLHNNRILLLIAVILSFLIFLIQLSNNGVYGRFLVVKYPFSQFIYSLRLFFDLSYPISWLMGIGIIRIHNTLEKMIGKSVVNIINRIVKKKYTKSFQTIIPTVCILLLLVSLGLFTQIKENYVIMYESRKDSIVTINDLKAYNWITNNTGIREVFFTSGYDGGAWIPMYTYRPIIPTFTLRQFADLTTQQKFELYFLRDKIVYGKEITDDVISLFIKYNVSYVYIGEKTQYGFPLVEPGLFLNNPFFELVFRSGNVYIFKFLKEKMLFERIIDLFKNSSVDSLTEYVNVYRNADNIRTEVLFNKTCDDLIFREYNITASYDFIIDNDNDLRGDKNITEYSLISNTPIEISNDSKEIYWSYHTNETATLQVLIASPTMLGDFLEFSIKGDESNHIISVFLEDTKENNIFLKNITLNFGDWKKIITAVPSEVKSNNVSKIIFKIFDKTTKEKSSVVGIRGFRTGYGTWANIVLKLPSLLVITNSRNNLPEAWLSSKHNNEFHSFAFWDYPYTSRAEIYTPSLYFLDNTSMHDVTGMVWQKGVTLYPIGYANENVVGLSFTDGFGSRSITYPSVSGYYIGFSIYLPPDDDFDANEDSISQVHLKFNVMFRLNITNTQSSTYNNTEDYLCINFSNKNGFAYYSQTITTCQAILLAFDEIKNIRLLVLCKERYFLLWLEYKRRYTALVQ